MVFELVQQDGSKKKLEKLMTLRMPKGRHTIGRADSAAITLPLKAVSKEHGYVEWDGAALTVKDTKSTFGTTVNGEAIKEVVTLKHGDHLRIGDPHGRADFRVREVPLRICIDDGDVLEQREAQDLAEKVGGDVVDRRWTEQPTHCILLNEKLTANALRCVLRDAKIVRKSWLDACLGRSLEEPFAAAADHAVSEVPPAAALRRSGLESLRGVAVVFPEHTDDDDLEDLISELSPVSAVRARVDLMDDPKKNLGRDIASIIALTDARLPDDLVPATLSRDALLEAVLKGDALPGITITKYLSEKKAGQQQEQKKADDDSDDQTRVSDDGDSVVPTPTKANEWISVRSTVKKTGDAMVDSARKLKHQLNEKKKEWQEHDHFELPGRPAETVYRDDLIVRQPGQKTKLKKKNDGKPNFKRFRKNYVHHHENAPHFDGASMIAVKPKEPNEAYMARLKREMKARDDDAQAAADLDEENNQPPKRKRRR